MGMSPSLVLTVMSLGAAVAACGSGSDSSGGAGAANGGSGAGIGTGSGAGSSVGGSQTGGGGASNGSGAGSGSKLYVEPDAIVGGACDAGASAATPPCPDDAPEQTYCRLDDPSDVIMATCWGYGIDQCEVMDDCAPSWHPCTATDYVARGGRDVVPDLSSATNRAWLAACVQDLGGGPQLRNAPCSYCGDTEYEPVVQWWCDGEVVSPGGMAGTTLGVLAAPECMRVGENVPGHGAHWNMAFTTDAPSFVVCCADAL
jgi:hypothetical protein